MRSLPLRVAATFFQVALVTACSPHPKGHGVLRWEQDNASFRPAVTDGEVKAHYRFKNIGDTPVSIRAIRSSCTCTTATASAPSYAPGETGEITAIFRLGERVGLQITELKVETDNPSVPSKLLAMAVIMPPIGTVDPEGLMWNPGEPMHPKEIRVTAAKGVSMKITRVESSDPSLEVHVANGTAPGQWRVIVTPLSDAPSLSASLHIQTDFPKDNPRSILARAQIAR